MARNLEVKITGDPRSLERAYGRATVATQGFGSSVAGANKSFTAARALIGTGMVGALMAFGSAAFRSAKDYDDAMDKIAGLTGASIEQMEGYEKAIKSMAGALATS